MTEQLTPPGITGKGSGFAEGASVLDHAFGTSEQYTLGVEEEYMLLDPETFDLVQHVDTVLAAVSGSELEVYINPELMQSVLEIATPVCRTAGVARRPGSPRRGRWSSPRFHAPAHPRASTTTATTPSSSASSSARAASPTTRTSGGTSGSTRASARSRCASAMPLLAWRTQ